jgi:hypothetical protein
MALQISEIGIRLAVGEPVSGQSPLTARADHGRAAPLSADQIDELVRRCVREVLASIERIGDR